MYRCRVHGSGWTLPGRELTRRRGDRSVRRGVALLEFAVALPFLVFFVFGVVDGTRALVTWIEMKNAAREGAVYAQNHPHQWQLDSAGSDGGICDDGNTVEDRTKAETSTPMTVVVTYENGSTLSPDYCRAPSSANPINPGDRVTVRTTTPFNAITPLVGDIFDSVSATVTVRVQG